MSKTCLLNQGPILNRRTSLGKKYLDQHPVGKNLIALFVIIVFSYFCMLQSQNTYASTDDTQTLESDILALFPRATRPPKLNVESKIWSIYQLNDIIGYAYQSNDFVDFKGFSGERINILIGLDVDGRFSKLKILHHHEPIFLHGLGPIPLQEFIDQYPLHTLSERIMFSGRKTGETEDIHNTYFDGVTKATVSVIVINDTILSSAREVARLVLPAFAQQAPATVRKEIFETLDWRDLVDQGLVKHWILSREDVEGELGQSLSNYPPGQLDLDYENTDIYYAYLNAPSIGKNLLGDADYVRLMDKLSDGEQAILIMSRGFYDYLSKDFRPGTIPEQVSLEQRNLPITLRDLNFFDSSTPNLLKDAPQLDNIRIFKIRPQAGFDPSAPMQMALNIKLDRNHLVHDSIFVRSDYQLPVTLFKKSETTITKPEAIWIKLWQGRQIQIAILAISLVILTIAFVMQRKLVADSHRFVWFRRGFLLFTLFYIGFYTQGQLSVVNLIALLMGALNNFNIQVFLLDPIIFILLCYTALTLILWGRGLFCGWLCPFGVMQEFLATLAEKLKIKQWHINPIRHQQLLKIKYVVLISLLATAPYSLTAAEKMAEIEPFKTAVTLVFIREWPFVIYAVLILGLGLFINKFYCRYLCPLGAALAIMGKFHRFKWLARRRECGSPCQLCKHRCGVDAIKKSGEIDYDECIQCLECVVILQDPQQCAAIMSADKKAKRHAATTVDPVNIIEGR
jgi:NosR/NirI family transcriptional regulator, nitrous oxide reductase regulator